MSYQTFSDQNGASRSSEKLARLGLPNTLIGKSVLDLGCNEGFFCIEAKRRGATYVMGIDQNPRVIESARIKAENAQLEIDFIESTMDALPDRQFDIILLMSALHYIPAPAALLRYLRNFLTPAGMLILEAGVHTGLHGRTVGRALRSIDERLFPTHDLLLGTWLKGYSVRRIGSSVPQIGDPVPRFVFHCRTALTNVMLIVGNGGIGKSTLASQLDAAPRISTDELFSPLRFDRPKLSREQRLYDEIFNDTKSIWATWDRIKGDDEVVSYFATAVADAIMQCDGAGLIIVEGFILDSLISEIQRTLGSRFRYWKVTGV